MNARRTAPTAPTAPPDRTDPPRLALWTPPRARARARAAPRPPRLIEPTETPLRINGWPCRVLSWTAVEWARLGAMQPTGSMRLAGGGRMLILAD